MINPDLRYEATKKWVLTYIEFDSSSLPLKIDYYKDVNFTNLFYTLGTDEKQLTVLAVQQAHGIRSWESKITKDKWLMKVYFPETLGNKYNGLNSVFKNNIRKIANKYKDLPKSILDEYGLNPDKNGNIKNMNNFAGIDG